MYQRPFLIVELSPANGLRADITVVRRDMFNPDCDGDILSSFDTEDEAIEEYYRIIGLPVAN